MNTKTTFTMLALMSWMLTFVVLVVSALHADCFFSHDTYQKKLMTIALVNMICVFYFMLIQLRQQTKGNE